MVITRAQLSTFERNSRETFHNQLIAYAREMLPEHTKHLSTEDLRTLVRKSETRAGEFCIVTQRGIAKWLCIALLGGETFDETPEVTRSLKEIPADAEQRLQELFESLCQIAKRTS